MHMCTCTEGTVLRVVSLYIHVQQAIKISNPGRGFKIL